METDGRTDENDCIISRANSVSNNGVTFPAMVDGLIVRDGHTVSSVHVVTVSVIGRPVSTQSVAVLGRAGMDTGANAIKLEFHVSSFLVASS